MPELSKDLIALLSYLAPGFLMAWVFYALTNHVKPTQFERVVQALVFTVIVKALVSAVQWLLETIGSKLFVVGEWTTNVEIALSLLTALALGVAFSVATNRDSFFGFLRKWKLSERSGDPSEWGYVFTTHKNYVVLHLADDRRLYGWPEVWPTSQETGCFFLVKFSWLTDGDPIEMTSDEGILVNVKDVKFVEFVKQN
jgi:Family of unknown function (DUF6338)